MSKFTLEPITRNYSRQTEPIRHGESTAVVYGDTQTGPNISNNDWFAEAEGVSGGAFPFRVVVSENAGVFKAQVMDEMSVVYESLSNEEFATRPDNFDTDLDLDEGENYIYLEAEFALAGGVTEFKFVSDSVIPEVYEIEPASGPDPSYQLYSRKLIATVMQETIGSDIFVTVYQAVRTTLQWEWYFTDQNAVKILRPF